MCFAVQVPRGRREQRQQQQQQQQQRRRFECVVGFLLGAPNKVVSTETYPSLFERHESY